MLKILRSVKQGIAACSTLAIVMIDLMVLPISSKPALAQSYRCPENRMCLFEDYNYNGSYYQFQFGSSDFRYLRPANFNDRTSSYWNRTKDTWCLWDDIGYRGQLLAQIPGGNWSYYVGSTLNDRASSLTKAHKYSNGVEVCLTA